MSNSSLAQKTLKTHTPMSIPCLPPKPVTDIFTRNDLVIDRRDQVRIVPMRVLALGLGRTGTASLRQALQILGYEDTYHMLSASVENPPDCILWKAAFDAKFRGKGVFGRREWDALLGHCQAVCDWPAAMFAPELIAAYPEAKVILTNRDVDSWHRSTLSTVYWRYSDPVLRVLSYFDWASSLYHPVLDCMFNDYFGSQFPSTGPAVFHAHYAELRALLPDDKLLEYRVTEGWGPLCQFLGHDVPGDEFPTGNEVASFRSRCHQRNLAQIGNVCVRAAAWMATLWVSLVIMTLIWHKI